MTTSDTSDETAAGWPDGGGPLRVDTTVAVEQPDGDPLIVDVAGFEGPLDLLLEMARSQKVDLTRISVLALAEQYLSFIAAARRLRLELAADYLVMAAWLTYLKSRLLLPPPHEDDEPPPEELAQRLAFRLQRLHAMREAVAQLMARNRLDRDVFGRGAPEPVVVERKPEFADTLVDLLKAYSERRVRRMVRTTYTVNRQPVITVKEARAVLERLIGGLTDWGRFDTFLDAFAEPPERQRSVKASSFNATLELVREGRMEMRQEGLFEPIYVRAPTKRLKLVVSAEGGSR
ncbi:MAG: ScpA family protein [Hyphomicrobiales bacterium]